MSENIAILVANSEYDELKNLDCCDKDLEVIHDLMKSCDKYHNIIKISNSNSADLKDKIRGAIESYESIDEIFFYYSGHGWSNDTEFFICPRDFKSSSPNQQGLSRSALHDIFRSAKPNLVVNIFDACESGQGIIKSDAHPITTKSVLRDYIQISSCLGSQNSWTGNPYSVFTREFVLSALNKISGPIYYTDIEASLRDAFLENESQTPYFIKQANSQERICDDASKLDELRKKITDDIEAYSQGEEISSEEFVAPSILQRFKDVEEKLVSKDKAQEFIDKLSNYSFEMTDKDKNLSKYYLCSKMEFDDYENIKNRRQIVSIVYKQNRLDRFVSVGSVEVDRNPYLRGSLGLLSGMYDFKKEKEYYINNNSGLQRIHVRIYYEPQFLALGRVLFEIVFVPCLDRCLVFTSKSIEPRSSWTGFDDSHAEIRWRWSSHKWNEDPKSIVGNYDFEANEFAQNHLNSVADSDLFRVQGSEQA